jgi:hypothetical protein
MASAVAQPPVQVTEPPPLEWVIAGLAREHERASHSSPEAAYHRFTVGCLDTWSMLRLRWLR